MAARSMPRPSLQAQWAGGSGPGSAKPPPRTRRRPAVAAPAATSSCSSAQRVTLPDGTALEVLSAVPAPASAGPTSLPSRPPLLFVHGSAHAAWCWADHFLPWFAERGWPAHAVSLRGRGRSGPPPPGAKAGGTLASHAADLAAVVGAGYGLEDGGGAPRASTTPILVGHSFGGLVAQAAAADPNFPLAGLILASSVPPSGNGPMIARIAAATGLWATAVTTADFVLQRYRTSPASARRLFFSEGMPEAEVARLVALLAANDGDKPVIDVRAIGRELPVAPPARPGLPALVLGGAADTIVDAAGLAETAAAVRAGHPVILPGLAHDIMLDVGWEAAAGAMADWLLAAYV